jgi:hypothetical protein
MEMRTEKDTARRLGNNWVTGDPQENVSETYGEWKSACRNWRDFVNCE